MTNANRRALSLYKTILVTAKNWVAKSGVESETLEHRRYIKQEAQVCFKNNKMLTDSMQIEEKIKQAEARLAIGLHYRNPYPRPVNVFPKTYSKKKKS